MAEAKGVGLPEGGGNCGTRGFARIFLLSNPHARRVRANDVLLTPLVESFGAVRLPNDFPAELPATLAAAALSPLDLLVINGGDGTVQGTLTALSQVLPMARWPLLALLPGGTTNMTAFDISGRVAFRRALAALTQAVTEPAQIRTRVRHALQLQAVGAPTRIGFLFGAGAIVNGIQYCREEILRRGGAGEWASGLALVRGAYGIAMGDPRFTGDARATIDFGSAQQPRPGKVAGEWLALLATTVDRMFMGIRPFWGDGAAPVHFTWVRSDARNFFLRLPWLVRRGRGLSEADGYASRDVNSLTLDLDSPYTIDGEIFPAPAGPLTLAAVGPYAFLVLRRQVGCQRRRTPVTVNPAFAQLLRGQCAAPAPVEVEVLVAAARQRFGGAVAAVLFYGSCRRTGDVGTGVADLYAIVDDRRAIERGWRVWLGAWLPPNVYYVTAASRGAAADDDAAGHAADHETDDAAGNDALLRAKVGVFTFAELERASCTLEPYVWGRLAQPVSLVYARDDVARERLLNVLAGCVSTFLDNALPLAAGRTAVEAWRLGLAASYATELRAERGGRATDIVGDDADYYSALTFAARPAQLQRDADGGWLVDPRIATRRPAALWRWRGLFGKFWSVLRLLKGLYTFDGGFDYIAWKLSRHAGRPIEIPERVRRWPWLFVWGLMLRLYREGVFR